MANQIKYSFSITASRTKILIGDLTGIYNAITNPSGYGGVNADLSNVTACTLYITKPDPITRFASQNLNDRIELNALTLGLPNYFNVPIEITAAMLEITDGIIPDGEYVVEVFQTFTVSSIDTIAEFSRRDIVFSAAKCCRDKAIADIDIRGYSGCDPCKEKTDNASLIDLYYNGLVANIQCAKTNTAVALLNDLHKLCEQCGCGC
jgi:hypothetical protein